MSEFEEIRNRIYEIRGRQVMLDFDLAALYGIETRVLKQSVRRNLKRFEGEDFMFELTKEELSRSQFVTLNKGRGSNFKYMPFAFTELGVAMLSSVLNSDVAIEINRRIMRTFVAVRQYITLPKCGNCQLEGEVKKLAVYIDEILADQNEINEDTRNAIAVLQAAVFPDVPEEKAKRVFEMEVKGFKHQLHHSKS